MIQYILEVITFQLVFLIIYDFWLKRETFFQWNRVYLIGTYIISMVLPWVKIEALKKAVPQEYYIYPEFLWNTNDIAAVTVTQTESTGFSISWEYALFFGGMFLASLFFANKLRQLYILKKMGKVQRFPDFTQIIIANSQIAFSFFKSVFMGDKVLETDYKSVIAHELVHIKQRHTYDLLFFELMRIVCWFNPLVYVYQSRVSELHEFIADAHAAKINKKEHYQLLLSQVFETQNISFINQFFKSSLIKKRIVMLQKTQSKKIGQLKYLLLVPMVLGMLAYTSAERETEDKFQVIQAFQSLDDTQLIAEIEKEINDEEHFNLVLLMQELRDKEQNQDYFFTKKEYFQQQLFMIKSLRITSTNGFSIRSENKEFLNRFPLPSTERYKNYIVRKKAFQILDNNLKFSINQSEFAIRKVEKEDQNLGPGEFLTVDNLGDLTGDEIRKVNRVLAQLDVDRFLFLSDDKNAFLIEKKDSQITQHLESKSASTVQEPRGLSQTSVETIPLTEIVIGVNRFSHSTMFPMMSIDEAPLFPVCESAKDNKTCFQENIINHFKKNFKYPKKAQENKIEGRVYLIFTIDEAGNVSNIRQRGSEQLLADEVVRIISLLPKMTPGKQKGKVIDVPFSIPITFKLDDDLLVPYGAGASAIKENVYVPFATVEDVPVFPGCEDAQDKRKCFQLAMQKHISDNFKYPKEAQEKGIQGRVSIMFDIDQEGNIGNIRKRGPDEVLEDEAVRIISLLPQMTPGKQKGKSVIIPFSIPITFKLQSKQENVVFKDKSVKKTSGRMEISGYRYNKNKGTASGTIVDESGLPLPGVNVNVMNSGIVATSDFDGFFTIPAKKDDILIFKYIGLPTKSITIKAE